MAIAMLQTALRAADLTGNGLYDVDVKKTANASVVIEVNNHPSLDSGIEDQVLGDQLYTHGISEFIFRLKGIHGAKSL